MNILFLWLIKPVTFNLKVSGKWFFLNGLIHTLHIISFVDLICLKFHNLFKILPFFLTSILPLPRPLIKFLGQFYPDLMIIDQFAHQL
jgi:hypothetical protein